MHRTMQEPVKRLLEQEVRRSGNVDQAFLMVHSEKHGTHLNLTADKAGVRSADPRQPYYTASVGKLFTAVLIGMMKDQGLLSFQTQLTELLDDQLIQGLLVLDGKDRTGEIQLHHLLSHTSGLDDHWKPMLEQTMEQPNRAVTPEDVLAWVKGNQPAVGAPGNKCRYSDTNYLLLGMVVERLLGLTFAQAVHQWIFIPLGMDRSSLFRQSVPRADDTVETAAFYSGKKRLNENRGLPGIDYAGGSVVSTGEDLLLFMKALTQGRLVRQDTLDQMMTPKGRFGPGIGYGYGTMVFQPVPLLMPAKYCIWGHAGATGSFLFYHPAREVVFAGTFNQFEQERRGTRFLFRLMQQLFKLWDKPVQRKDECHAAKNKI